MSLKHAMLGFLSIENMNGYQLKKHFDESVSKFWSVSISQIYPTLSDMLKSDLIAIENNSGDSTRGSKIYSITEKGKEELKCWLSKPIREEPFRSEMLLKLYFSSNIEPDVLIQHFLQQKNDAQERIEFYQSYIEHLENDHLNKQSLGKDAVYWRMTVRFGIFKNNALIEWCDECIEILKQHRSELEV